MLIYPENWVEPTPIPEVVLTTAQRDALKTRMKTYLNNKGIPIELKELIDIAQDYVLEQTGKHIHDRIFREIALEIQYEWYPPEQPAE